MRAWPALARTHVALRGALIAGTRERLRHTLDALAEPGMRITLDLSDVATIDADGADTLAGLVTRVGERRGELVLEDASAAVRDALARRRDRG